MPFAPCSVRLFSVDLPHVASAYQGNQQQKLGVHAASRFGHRKSSESQEKMRTDSSLCPQASAATREELRPASVRARLRCATNNQSIALRGGLPAGSRMSR